MSDLSAKEEEHEVITQDTLDSHSFLFKRTSSGSSLQCPRENIKTLNSDQADLFSHVSFLDPIKTDGPAKAAHVNGSTSPQISDEIFLDISKNVPGFIPKTLHAQNSTVTTSNQFDSDPLKKDGEMTIRQMLTAENVEDRGIWGFDMDSPESSSDNYDNGNDFSWDAQREFMKFLWDDHEDPEMVEKIAAVSPLPNQRKKKRKLNMMVVDPTEDLDTDLGLKYQNQILGEGSKPDPYMVDKEQSQRKQSKLQLPGAKHSQYSNGTTDSLNELILKPTGKKTGSRNRKLGSLKDHPSTDSGSEEEPSFYPCTKCNINFKEKSHLHRHMKYHSDPPSQINAPRPFICKECGRSLRNRKSLQRHMAIHQERRQKLMERIKGLNELKDEGREARLQCPQCTFGTNCPNTFVQHAKTHEKDKRYYGCQKCSFMAVTDCELSSHMLSEHRVSKVPLLISKQDGVQELKIKVSDKHTVPSSPTSFSCKLCSFRTTNKTALRNHVKVMHRRNSEEVYGTSVCQESDNFPSLLHLSPVSKSLAEASESPERSHSLPGKQETSRNTEFSSWPEEISSLLGKEHVKQKERKMLKSRLDTSINILLSRQRHVEHRSLECSSNQRSRKTSSTTGLRLTGECRNEHLNLESTQLENKRTTSPSSCLKSTLGAHVEMSEHSCNSETGGGNSGFCIKPVTLEKPIMKKSPSKRKMSTPYHNMQGQDILSDFPKCRPNFKKQETTENQKISDDDDSFKKDYAYDNDFNITNSCQIKDDHYVGNHFVKKQRSSTTSGQCSSGSLWKQDISPPRKLAVKEECIEAEIFDDTSSSTPTMKRESFSEFEAERKSCPYCPAVFESGVGLSNHVRGHLHRVGLSYNARHVVSAAQVASQDKMPRIRRRMGAVRHIKTETALQLTEAQDELTCPLCREWFDTRTGLSNHVRGHLKRLKKAFSTTAAKSPVLVLKELMRDKKQFQARVQALQKKSRESRSVKHVGLISSNGLFYSSTAKVQSFRRGGKQQGPVSSQSGEERREKKRVETKDGVKGSPSSDLIGILKKRKTHEETKVKSPSQTARKAIHISPTKERGMGIQIHKALPNSISDKSDLNRKVCVHCNATFHSGVSLSNHLRAYARRKRNALLEGTTYDCKQRKQRSRSGSKKKTHPSLHMPEEIYRLTCRFCDLVFQGPLSVQEDWIKHLQRHIMNTSVPHTGAGMVEVTSFPKDPSMDREEQAQPTLTQAAC